MAGETIRDVVIRIRTEFQNSGGAGGASTASTAARMAGATSPAQTAGQVRAAVVENERAVRDGQKALDLMKQRFSIAQKEIGLAEMAAKKRAEQIRDAERAIEAEKKIAAEKFRQIAVSEKTAAFQRRKMEENAAAEAKEWANAQKAAVAARAAQARAMDRVEAANIRATAAMKSLGESSMLAIRGLALLSASGSKDVERILHSLLVVQGVIDLYKGLTGVLGGVARAYQAITVASTAAATAQAVSAAAGGAGAGGGAARGAMAGLATGTGVSLLSRFGLYGAAVGIGAGVGYGLGYAADRFLGTDIQGGRAERERLMGNLAIERREDLANMARRRNVINLTSAVDFNQERTGLRTGAGLLTPAQRIRQQRFVIGEIGGARRDLIAGTGGTNRERLEDDRELLVRQIAAHRELLSASRELVKQRERQVEGQRESLRLAKEAVQAEKDRTANIQGAVGRLNAGEFAQLKRIAGKVGRGEDPSERELQFAESRLGQASADTIASIRQRRGAKLLGTGAELAPLVDRAGLNLVGPGSNEDALTKVLVELQKGSGTRPNLGKLLENLTKERANEATEIEKATTALRELGGIDVKLKLMREEIDRLAREQRRINAARDL